MESRLDVLIYAHDGRGLGHVSRSVSVGMALRRKYPGLKVLFVSGCAVTQELIDSAPLDWLKLPSYKTEVVGGKSVGQTGDSCFSDKELGQLRGQAIAQMVSLYQPRVVLVDHTPQGKHRELLQGITVSGEYQTRWILGVRGVMGGVAQAKSSLAREVYNKFYHSLLWYGDSSVLSTDHLHSLRRHYSATIVECGYVLRFAELGYWKEYSLQHQRCYAGTVSIPWLGEQSLAFLQILAKALENIPDYYGRWQLFIDMDSSPQAGKKIRSFFQNNANCKLQSPGKNYSLTLLRSKTALICGGYNSLMDTVFARVPALVVMRAMHDEEQQIHLRALDSATQNVFSIVSETEIDVDQLTKLLLENLQKPRLDNISINTAGAENAAEHIFSLLP